MENIDQFVMSCESWAIDTDCFSIVTEGLADNIKRGLSWLVNKGRELLTKFIAWVKALFIKLTNSLDLQKLKTLLKEKCHNDKNEVYTFIKDIDDTVAKYAFPGNELLNYYKDVNSHNIESDIEKYIKNLTSQNSYDSQQDRIDPFLDSDLPKLISVLQNGYSAKENALKTLEDKNDKLKEVKSELFLINIEKIVKLYKDRLSTITNNYSAIKATMQSIVNSLKTMNQTLDSLKRQVDSGSTNISEERYSTISKSITHINRCVNGTVVSHNQYMASVQLSSNRFVFYIDRLTYGRDPNSKESQAEYSIPDYRSCISKIQPVIKANTDSVLIETVNLNGTKTNIWCSTLANQTGPITIFGNVQQFMPGLAFKPVSDGCSILIPPIYWENINEESEKKYKFVMYHEYGHIVHKDFDTKDGTKKQLQVALHNYRQILTLISHKDSKIENNADLYAIKSLNLSKNEYDKAGQDLKTLVNKIYDDKQVPEINRKLGYDIINNRVKDTQKEINKKG